MWFDLIGFKDITNYNRLYNAIFSLFIHSKYIWFALDGFHGITNIVGYLMPKTLQN